MLPSYFMAGFNLVAFLIIFVLFFFIQKKYPKVQIYSLPFLLLFAFLPLVSIARVGTYESGDLSLNVYKTMEFFRSLQEGNILPTWAGHLNALYGYPLFIFTYPLPYFLNAFFHVLGFSFVSSVKMTLVTSFLLSGTGMYYFLKERFSSQAAFLGSILYLYTPYHLVDMHFRVDIGEMCAIAVIPFIFLSLEKVSKERLSPLWISLGSLSVALLILSHQAVSLTALPFTILYIFIVNDLIKLKKIGYRFVIMYISGVLLAGFYVFPLLYLKEFTIQSLGVTMSFAPLKGLLYSPYRYGLLFQGPNGELSFLLGYTQIILIVIGFWVLKKTKLSSDHKKLLLFSLGGIGILVFFMLQLSSSLWFIIPLIKNFQFSYRLLSVMLFFFAVLGAIVTQYIKKPFLITTLLFLTIIITILNWGNRRTIPEIGDKQLAAGLPQSSYFGEGLQPAAPKWVDINHLWMKDPPASPLEVLSGKATISTVSHSISKHQYKISVAEPSEFKENTLYFPDWKIYANQKPVSIFYTNPKYPGIMTFKLPRGNYAIDVIYKNPLITTFSRVISLMVFLLLLLWNLIFYRRFFFVPLHKKR